MNNIKNLHIEKYFTPHKLGRPVLSASGKDGMFDSNAIDCPFIFYHKNLFHMMYVGFDGKGYQTAMAVSSDLFNWEYKKVIFRRNDRKGWDSVGVVGTWIIKNDNLFELPTLRKIDGRYWMTYHSYPEYGYEEGPAEIGLAWCEDEDLEKWHRIDNPVLSWKDGADWENAGLYKSCIVEKDGIYYMFYNAKNKSKWIWTEQTGLAVSSDLLHWERHKDNPVIKVKEKSWQSAFVSDPCVVRDEDIWVMFYFGYDGKNAQEGIAFSNDLIDWQQNKEPIICIGKEGEIDEIHAHKPSVIYYRENLYHFYCSVRKCCIDDIARNTDSTNIKNSEFRSITVATSKDIKI